MNEENDVFSIIHVLCSVPVGLMNFELVNVANAIPIQGFLARYGRLASCMTANQLDSSYQIMLGALLSLFISRFFYRTPGVSKFCHFLF